MSKNISSRTEVSAQTPESGRPRARARTLLVAMFGILTALALTASPGTAQASEAAPGARTGETVTAGAVTADAEQAAVTCNYRATVKINLHAAKDRSSAILGTWAAGTVFYGASCTNETGGSYASCGADNLWKRFSIGWLPTKCLVRV